MSKDINNILSPEYYSCHYYIPNHDIGFKVVCPQKGAHYSGKNYKHNNIVFVIEGELEFSYNDFINRRFVKGDFFMLPHATDMHGTAIKDSKILILVFNNNVKSVCDNCAIYNFSAEISSTNYDFRPLKLTPILNQFVDMVVGYLSIEAKCNYLDQLKQKELFILMRFCYSRKELIEFFYPIMGGSHDFKSRVIHVYQDGLTINDFANKFNMSPKNFSRKFKNEFGETVHKWMISQKANNIKMRLSKDGVTITEVVDQFGFKSATYFWQYCKKQFGCTPTELIKQLRNNN